MVSYSCPKEFHGGFSRLEGESMNIRTHAISLYRVKATKRSIKQLTATGITHKAIRHCAYAFSGNLSRNSFFSA